MRALLVWMLLCGCGRVAFDPPVVGSDGAADGPPACLVPIDTGALTSDSGFAWAVFGQRGMFGLADANGALTQSTLRLFEDGVELGPAHAPHTDIRAIGLGRFSHWATSNLPDEDGIRFAASDNSDPRSNGRRYGYCP